MGQLWAGPLLLQGVGVLLAGMWGGWTCTAAQNRLDRLTLEVGIYLDLSCLAPGPKEPLRLGLVACPSFKSRLRPTFRPTLLTLKCPGTPHCWELDANWTINVPLKCHLGVGAYPNLPAKQYQATQPSTY